MPEPARPPYAFISYRTEDSAAEASRLAADLKRDFGADAAFIDHRDIPPGADYPDELQRRVREAHAVLVLVGKRWLTAQDPFTGQRRLDMPDDWVRQEVALALDAGRTVLPVRVEGAAPLTQAQLPQPIKRLADKQSLPLRRTDWDADVALIELRLSALGFQRVAPLSAPAPAPPQPRESPPRSASVRAAVLAAMVMGVLGLVVWMWLGGTAPPRPPASAATPLVADVASAAPAPPAPAASKPASTPPTSAAPPPTVQVEGRIGFRVELAADYRARAQNFIIEAGKATAQPDADGSFSLGSVAAPDAIARLSWTTDVPGDAYVLWPMTLDVKPPQRALFYFDKLDNVYIRARDDAKLKVGRGDVEGADTVLNQLYPLLDIRDDARRFLLLQELCTHASNYRDKVARDDVPAALLKIERRWRKQQFAAARTTPAAVPNLMSALNGWAAFSRQAYSRQQRRWPDQPVFDDPKLFAEGDDYAKWLREDLDAVRVSLAWLRDEAPRRPAAALDAARLAVLNQVVDGDLDQISMSRLADLLNRLNTLKVPTR